MCERIEKFRDDSIECPFEALAIIKDIIRSASRDAIKEVLKLKPEGIEEKLQLVMQAVRSIRDQDVRLAKLASRDFPDLAACLNISDTGVRVADAAKFDALTQQVAHASAVREEELADSKDKRKVKKRGGRCAIVARWLQLWSPFGKRAVSVAIVRADGEATKVPQEKAQVLAKHWGDVFRQREVDLVAGAAFVAEHSVPLDLTGVRRPDAAVFESFIRRTRHSAPGPDGIPYGCWRCIPKVASRVLVRALGKLTSSGCPPDGFNDSVGFFIPKGSLVADSLGVVREAAETRPLGAKNCDNKLIAGAVNRSIAPALSAWADDSQKGFIKGRYGLEHIVNVDATARQFDAEASAP